MTVKQSKPKRATKTELISAIQSSGGNFTAIGKRFGVTRQAIAKRVKADPSLMAMLDESRESLLDVAESGLAKAIKQGKPWAIRFFLSTIGQSRGYGKSIKVDADVSSQGKVVLFLPDNGRDRRIAE